MTTIHEIKNNNPKWFSPENKRFFGDVDYFVLHDSEHKPYLIRSTFMWSDMFGVPKKLVYRINKINPDLSIGDLYEEIFKSYEEAKTFLKD